MHPQCTPSGPKRTPVRGRISKKLDLMCPQCGQSFESYRYDVEQRKRMYCSMVCQGKAHRMAKPPREELVGLYAQGVSTNGLAFHYKVSKGTIYNWLKSYGVKTRTNGTGVTLAQTGKKHSAEHNAAIGRGHQGKKMSPEARLKLVAKLTGRKLSPDHAAKARKANKGRVFSDDHKKAISDALKGQPHDWCAGEKATVFRYNDGRRFTTRAGKRESLGGLFVRSSWEANYALYLEFLKTQGEIHDWKYEAFTFWFHAITRGIRSYTPDFAVWERLGDPEKPDYFVEVKGYMDQPSRTKLDRMKRYYPEVRVVLIDKDAYKAIRKWRALIPGWE